MRYARFALPAFMMIFGVALLLSLQPSSTQAQTGPQFGTGWIAAYFNNPDLAGSPVISQSVAQVNLNFGAAAPIPQVPADNFSIRFTANAQFAAGQYNFTLVADDGARAIVNSQTIIDFYTAGDGQSNQTVAVEIQVAGTVSLVVEYVDRTGNAFVQFFWEPVGLEPTPTEGPSPTPTNTGLPPIPPGAITATVIRAGVLNVRDAPSLGGGVVSRILRGQTYAVVGRDPDARWFLLQLSGFQAWAYGYYLFIDGNEFTPPIASASTVFGFPPGVTDTGVLAQTRAGMKLRAQPNIQSAQTGRITWGAFLPVTGRTPAGDWYQVIWKGTVGWVFTGFLDIAFGDLNNVPIINP